MKQESIGGGRPRPNKMEAQKSMKAQKLITPPISNCVRCGAPARCIDWDFRDQWRVMCDNNHTDTRECGTWHRAICRWNNRQKQRQQGKGE